jgi:carboxyl-terminal processing protease
MVTLLLVMTIVFAAGFMAGRKPQTATVSAQTDDREALFAPFWEAYDVLNERYVDPLDQETLVVGAIEGMIASVEDENTEYLTLEELSNWNDALSGEFEGIGATVRQDEVTGGLIIVAPLPGSPAEESGLLAGDQIVQVGGEDVTELDQTEIIGRVRGPAGTPVRLGILREGEADIIEFTVIRARIELPDVEFRMLDNNVGYIRLYNFSGETGAKLAEALAELDAESLNGLVLDLRNNPGGYLDTSLQVLSQFVEEGPILIEQLPGEQEQVFEAFGGASAPTVPLAILVDGGSASASELVAGSLRDLERAVVVGMPTFGKNTVQTIQPLTTIDGAMRITIARWITPDGNSSQPAGIVPDVEVEYDPESDPEMDNQLQAAIRALKGMTRQQLAAPQG